MIAPKENEAGLAAWHHFYLLSCMYRYIIITLLAFRLVPYKPRYDSAAGHETSWENDAGPAAWHHFNLLSCLYSQVFSVEMGFL